MSGVILKGGYGDRPLYMIEKNNKHEISIIHTMLTLKCM